MNIPTDLVGTVLVEEIVTLTSLDHSFLVR
jgi:hypothetical protein